MSKLKRSMTGAEFRKLREARQLSRAEVAAGMGVSESTVIRWERAPYVPETASRLMSFLWG